MRDACRLLLGALVGLLLLVHPVAAVPLQPDDGVLLVARDGLPDPRFHEAVVLLMQNDQQGAAGLVINRPSRLPLRDLVPEYTELFDTAVRVSYGGPVADHSLLALVEDRHQPPQPARQLYEDLYVTGIDELAEWLAGRQEPGRYRVFLGYAGWAPGQLESELSQGDWQVLPASSVDLLGAPETGMWQQLVR